MAHGQCHTIRHMAITILGMAMVVVGILGITLITVMEGIMAEVAIGLAIIMDIMMVSTIDIIMEMVTHRITEVRDTEVVILREVQFLEIQVAQETHQER